MSQELAILQKGTIDVVTKQVKEYQQKGELYFPENYSPDNALKSAWLKLQSATNRNGAPVLEACTQDSIASSLLDMVVQGLSPAKDQGYFIAYGRNLVFQRSYFGTMAVTKRVSGAKDIIAQAVYEGDEFEYEIKSGKKVITKHKQSLGNAQKDKIIGAYCTIIFDDREFTEIMSIDEIKQAWKQSKTYSDKDGTPHKEFPAEMAKKTVINRTCKTFLKSSDDGSLVMQHIKRSDEAFAEAQVEEEISENANSEYIDVDYEEVTDEEPIEAEQEIVEDEFAKGSSGGPDF